MYVQLFPDFGKTEWKLAKAETDSSFGEEHTLVWAVRQILGPRVWQEDEAYFLTLLCDIFPQSATAQLKMEKEEKEQPLEVIIREVMKEDNLMDNQNFKDKVFYSFNLTSFGEGVGGGDPDVLLITM